MSTTEAPPDRAEPPATPGRLAGLRERARPLEPLAGRVRRLPGIVWVVAIALLALAIQHHPYPSYDYAFALASGQDILRERPIAYGIEGVPTPLPHPLTIFVATLASAVGAVTNDAVAFWFFALLALLAFGLLVYAVFRLGTELFSWPVGLVAGALVFTAGQIFSLAVRTYGDVTCAALVVYATVLFARDPRGKNYAPLGLLALAGLLRPEVWVLAGLLWLWLFRGRDWQTRIGTALLVAAAPVIWVLSDLYVAGDPLHAYNHNTQFSEEKGHGITLGAVPDRLWEFLDSLMTAPIVLGAIAGLVFAVLYARRRALLPFVLGAVTIAVPLGLALLGGTVTYQRFYIVPAAMLALFFALGMVGWTTLGRGGPRRAWQVVGALMVALVVVSAIDRFEFTDRKQTNQDLTVRLLEDLRELSLQPALRPYVKAPECEPITTQGFLVRPYLRFWLDVPAERVSFEFGGPTPTDGVVVITNYKPSKQLGVFIANNGNGRRNAWLRTPAFRRDFKPVARDELFSFYAGPKCRAAVRARARS